jgi:hypothetical protein
MCKLKFAAKVFLDLTSLPAKIQLILSKFGMIVIAKILKVNKSEQTKDIDEQQMMNENVYYCEVNVEQLVALHDM